MNISVASFTYFFFLVKEFKVFPEADILWSPVEVFGQLIHPGVEIDFVRE